MNSPMYMHVDLSSTSDCRKGVAQGKLWLKHDYVFVSVAEENEKVDGVILGFRTSNSNDEVNRDQSEFPCPASLIAEPRK